MVGEWGDGGAAASWVFFQGRPHNPHLLIESFSWICAGHRFPGSLPYDPGKGGPPRALVGEVGRVSPSHPQPMALPLTSCSPTRSWFLAEREPGEDENESHLGFPVLQLGGDGKLSCLPSSRGHLVSFRGSDSHVGVHVCTGAHTPLFWAQRERPEGPVKVQGHL